jgi:hypothetical protein
MRLAPNKTAHFRPLARMPDEPPALYLGSIERAAVLTSVTVRLPEVVLVPRTDRAPMSYAERWLTFTEQRKMLDPATTSLLGRAFCETQHRVKVPKRLGDF